MHDNSDDDTVTMLLLPQTTGNDGLLVDIGIGDDVGVSTSLLADEKSDPAGVVVHALDPSLLERPPGKKAQFAQRVSSVFDITLVFSNSTQPPDRTVFCVFNSPRLDLHTTLALYRLPVSSSQVLRRIIPSSIFQNAILLLSWAISLMIELCLTSSCPVSSPSFFFLSFSFMHPRDGG